MPIDPFGLLGSAIANVVSDSLTAAMLALWNAGLWVLRAVLELEDAILTPSLGEDGPVGELYATTFWIALALVGILMFVLPTLAIGSWAWEVTPLTARVLGAVLILPGTVNVWMLLDGRWSAFKWIVQAELVCMVFLNIAIVLCRDQLDWRNAVTIPVVVVLAASLLFFAWLYVDGERRARRVRLSGTT